MEIETRDFGKIEINEAQIIYFPEGIYAFENAKRFALIAPKENEYPMWLQCIDELRPCFIVFDPYIFCEDYDFSLSDSEKAFLKIKDDSNLKVLCIANVPEDFRDTTVNMKSPIAINMDNKTAIQVILQQGYPYRQPIYKKTEEGD